MANCCKHKGNAALVNEELSIISQNNCYVMYLLCHVFIISLVLVYVFMTFCKSKLKLRLGELVCAAQSDSRP